MIFILRIKEKQEKFVDFMAKIMQKCVSVAIAIAQVWRTYVLEKFGAKLVPQNWKLLLSVEKKLPRILRRIIVYNLEINFPRRLQKYRNTILALPALSARNKGARHYLVSKNKSRKILTLFLIPEALKIFKEQTVYDVN